MRPRTPVRQPVIAGARREQLSELLRRWRQQPRKRSPLLFWAFLALALMSDSGLIFLTARFLDFWGAAALSAEYRSLTWESWSGGYTPARHGLYGSLLAVSMFAAAAVVRWWRPLWRRRFLYAGMLAGFASAAWPAAAALLGLTFPEGATALGPSGQEIVWIAAVVMVLGLSLAVLCRDTFLALASALVSSLGFLAAYYRLAFVGSWRELPMETADGPYLLAQIVPLVAGYAMLLLAWGAAALSLMRILVAVPSHERLQRLAVLCLWPIRLGVALLAISALLGGWRTIPFALVSTLGMETQGWNMQAVGTLLVLPGGVALLYAHQRGWLPPFRLLAAVVLSGALVEMIGQAVLRGGTADREMIFLLAADAGSYLVGLASLSLTAHAALRYYVRE
jgi:hypothetical protein